MNRFGLAGLVLPWLLGACSSSETPLEKRPADEVESDLRAEPWVGDGTLETVRLVELYDAPVDLFCSTAGCRPGLAVDLEFNPARPDELWVIYRQPYAGESCESTDPRSLGCQLLSSKVAILTDAQSAAPAVEIKEDGNAWHFMRVPTALAFGPDGTFATVGEARTGNYMDEGADYMGPTWWSSDPSIFAQDFMLNGSHLDMLHATPFGMGIAHDPSAGQDPVYWAFNGQLGSLDRYDFNLPHEPGGEDHTDGEYTRYTPGALKMVPGVPSHLHFANLAALKAGAEDEWWLYVADTGNQRIVRLDPTSGGPAVAITTQDGQIAAPQQVADATLEVVVPPGKLRLPSGLAVAGELLFVGDADTSKIHVFDLEGESIETLDTELPPGSLSGLAIGPDERLYFADWNEGRVFRVELK